MPKTLKHFKTEEHPEGDKEALKQYYRDMQKKSRENYKGTGGFAALNRERLSEIGRLGGLASAKKRATQKEDEGGEKDEN